MLVSRELNKLYREFPQMQIEKIDILTHPGKAFAARIKMIPTLKTDNAVLSGILLKSADIRKFVIDSLE